jgi:inorganic pyrophosphatase
MVNNNITITQTMSDTFWDFLDQLIQTHELVIDRPKGSRHPRFPIADWVYPLDYGYLQGTTTQDGGGIDVWSGASGQSILIAVMLTVDMEKKDAELKLLLGCSEDEINRALNFLNSGNMRATILYRPKESL